MLQRLMGMWKNHKPMNGDTLLQMMTFVFWDYYFTITW